MLIPTLKLLLMIASLGIDMLQVGWGSHVSIMIYN